MTATAVHTIDAEMLPEYSLAVVHETGDPGPRTAKTILDLNEHCWQAIFDYIPKGEIVCSERVSRGWQAAVHRYLREAGVCFVPLNEDFAHYNVKIHPKNRLFIIDFYSIYNHSETDDVLTFLGKWGPCILHTLCPSPEVFGKIIECCPKLKSLTITMNTFRSVHLSQDQAEFVEKLERIIFIDYTCAEYDSISYRRTYLQKTPCPRPIFRRYDSFGDIDAFSGFWPNFRPAKLKSLTIRGIFDLSHFLAAVECFPELTDLNLQGDLTNVRYLLERTPKLDRLCMMDWKMQNVERPGSVCRPPCGLQSLKCLILWRCEVCSWWLETVLENTPNLQVLDLSRTVLPMDAAGLCRGAAAGSLTTLRLLGNYGVRDCDAATLVAGCPKLTVLDLRQCYYNISRVVGKAVAPSMRGREEPLWLQTSNSPPYGWLVYDNESVPKPDLRPPPSDTPRQYIGGRRDVSRIDSYY